MRVKWFGYATMLAMGWCALTATPVAAQDFPSQHKKCKKQGNYEIFHAETKVADMNGGVGVVRIVYENYGCKVDGVDAGLQLFGMRNAAGQQIVPNRYWKVLPFSTTGALVIEPSDRRNPAGAKYKVYTAGAGEGVESFDFQETQLFTLGTKCTLTGDNGISVPFGRVRAPNGVSDVTLFTPSGQPRKLIGVGGEGIEPAVQRFGDVFRVRWRDQGGLVRTGLIDLVGNQVAPVLGASHVWSTLLAPGADRTAIHNCYAEVAFDLLIEGPSLDRDPARVQYGSLLTLVGRDGLPVPMPDGAAGLINTYRIPDNIHRPQQKNNTTMWAVVFPTRTGLEFTLHVGPPTDALVEARTAPRYSELVWTQNRWLMVKAKADGRWRLLRQFTDRPVGEPNADFQKALDSGAAFIDAENAAKPPIRNDYIGVSFEEGERLRQQSLIVAFQEGELCRMPNIFAGGLEWVTIYIARCDSRYFQPGTLERARAMGVTDGAISASVANGNRMAAQAQAVTAQSEANRRANAQRQSSYIPGQWESAIRSAGDALTRSVNDSSDAWLKQRRDQYNADWQRSQRAY